MPYWPNKCLYTSPPPVGCAEILHSLGKCIFDIGKFGSWKSLARTSGKLHKITFYETRELFMKFAAHEILLRSAIFAENLRTFLSLAFPGRTGKNVKWKSAARMFVRVCVVYNFPSYPKVRNKNSIFSHFDPERTNSHRLRLVLQP